MAREESREEGREGGREERKRRSQGRRAELRADAFASVLPKLFQSDYFQVLKLIFLSHIHHTYHIHTCVCVCVCVCASPALPIWRSCDCKPRIDEHHSVSLANWAGNAKPSGRHGKPTGKCIHPPCNATDINIIIPKNTHTHTHKRNQKGRNPTKKKWSQRRSGSNFCPGKPKPN